MKANEAPKKLYYAPYGDIREDDTITDNDIEYIRKDAFIEKACEFLKSYRQEIYDGQGYIAGIVNDKTIEDFKNYMKGE